MGNPYDHYYLRQVHGGGGISTLPVFRGRDIQRGSGLGNLLNAAFRMILPGIKSVGKMALREGVRAGSNVLSDVIGGENVKTSLKRRAAESGENLMTRALGGLLPPPPPTKKRKARSSGEATAKKTRGKKRRPQSGRGRGGVHRRTKTRIPTKKKSASPRRRKRKTTTKKTVRGRVGGRQGRVRVVGVGPGRDIFSP